MSNVDSTQRGDHVRALQVERAQHPWDSPIEIHWWEEMTWADLFRRLPVPWYFRKVQFWGFVLTMGILAYGIIRGVNHEHDQRAQMAGMQKEIDKSK